MSWSKPGRTNKTVNYDRIVFRMLHHQESATTKRCECWLTNRCGADHAHHRIDGISAALQYFGACLRCRRMACSNCSEPTLHTLFPLPVRNLPDCARPIVSCRNAQFHVSTPEMIMNAEE